MKYKINELIEELKTYEDQDEIIIVDIWSLSDIKNHFFDDYEEDVEEIEDAEKTILSEKILEQMADDYDANDGLNYAAAQAAYRKIILDKKNAS